MNITLNGKLPRLVAFFVLTAPALYAVAPGSAGHAPVAPANGSAPGNASSDQGEAQAAASEQDPEDHPIAIPAHPFLTSDFQKLEDDWYDRNMVHPFLDQIPEGTPWKVSAGYYIKVAIRTWEKQLVSFKAPGADGKELMSMGCDDPLISILTQFFRCQSGDKANTVELAKAAFEKLDHDRKYPPAVVRIAALATNEVIRVGTSQRSAEIDARAVQLAKDAVAAGNYAGADESLLLHHLLAWAWGWNHLINNYDALAAALAQAKAPQWIQHALKAKIEAKLAWDARGTGFADTVTRQGWLSFEQRNAIARDEYTASWKEHPTDPLAAGEMIGITMEGGANAGDTMRLWFDRAIAAQFDYVPAYDAMAWGLRPRWGGSVERMLAFARVCAETRRFDTVVPEQFFRILDNASDEEDWRKVYRSPIVADIAAPTAMGLADSPSRRSRWQQQYSLAAVEAYLAGDGAAAAGALNETGGTLASEGRNLLYKRGGDFDVMQREIAVLQSPGGKSFWLGEQAYDQDQLDQALDAFRQSAATLKGSPLAAAPLAKAESIGVEKAMGSGGWVKLPMKSATWHFQGGKWVTTNALEIDGSGGNATAYATPRIGPKFELRGEIEVDSKDTDQPEVAVLLGEHGTGYFVACRLKRDKGANTLHASASDRWDHPADRAVEVASKTPNTFLIRVENGAATFQVNGTPVVANYRADSSPLDEVQSRIGFAVRGIHAGTTIKIRNFEVRTNLDRQPVQQEITMR